jgi:hypothetical protein
MSSRELTATLSDLMKADVAADSGFWFLIQGKSEPTKTDETLVEWLTQNEVYFEVLTDDPDSLHDLYSGSQETHTAKKISQKTVALMQSKPEEDETAELLAMFYSVDDANAPEDRWLNGVIQAAYDAGFPTRALNDGLVEIDLSEAAAEAEAEPEPEVPAKPAGAVKKVAKKAAAPAADTPVPEEDETPAPSTSQVPTRDELEDMEPSEIKEVAAAMGIVLPPRTRATTYIDAILGEGKNVAPEAEVEDVAPIAASNGDHTTSPLDGKLADLAVTIVDLLIDRLKTALG